MFIYFRPGSPDVTCSDSLLTVQGGNELDLVETMVCESRALSENDSSINFATQEDSPGFSAITCAAFVSPAPKHKHHAGTAPVLTNVDGN